MYASANFSALKCIFHAAIMLWDLAADLLGGGAQ